MTLVMLAIGWALMYGIIIKFTLENDILFTVKTYVPEALVLCALFVAFLSGLVTRIGADEIILSLVLCFVYCLGVLFDDSSNALVLVRDVYIPVLFMLFVCSIQLSDAAMRLFINALTVIMGGYIIGSVVLYAVEAYYGYEWTARFYTGYVFWGQDPVSKIQINSNGAFMRLPGLTGSSVKSSMYGVLDLCVFLANDYLRGFRRFTHVALAYVCTFVFNNRSSMLAAATVFIFSLLGRVSNDGTRRLLKVLCAIVCFTGVLFLFVDDEGPINLGSMYERFDFWSAMFSDRSISNLLIPTSVFSASAGGDGIEGVGLSTVWDNAYLYVVFGFGIVVFCLLIAFFVRQWCASRLLDCRRRGGSTVTDLMRCLIVATAVLALATNVFQGRSWFFVLALVSPALMGYVRQYSSPSSVIDERRECSRHLTSKGGVLQR